MLKLNQLYFRNFLVIFFLTLFLTTFLGYFILKKVEIDSYKLMLQNSIKEYLLFKDKIQTDTFVKGIKKELNIRVTIIQKDGKVIFDSDANPKTMENHSQRPEILEAIKNGWGSSVRYSHTIKKDLLYVAKKDDAVFVRLAYPLSTIYERFLNFWLQTIFIFAFSLAISFYIALKINKKVTSDLKLIKSELSNMLESRYDVFSSKVTCCKEFVQIYKRIVKISKKLRRRDEQSKKFTSKLKAISKKQGDIISAISHEFKNPIAAITGYAQTIDDDPNINPQIRQRFIKKVISNAEKISNMIDRLSLAVKLESDNLNIQKNKFNLKPMCIDIKETILHKHKNREVILEVEDVEVFADKTMMEHVLINLVDNALKYSEDEVILRVTKDKVEVIDSGIGIEEENLKKITDRFFRVDTLSWDNSIGVGLYIVDYILKLHETKLKIDSKIGRGSVFWFSLGIIKQ